MARQHNILIVEDDPVCGRLLLRLVEKLGLTPLRASTCRGAHQLLRANDVDLVLLDRALPDRDGLSLCLEMKKDAALRHVPVIVLTGLDATAQQCQGYRYGADLYLSKPFSASILTRYIQAFLRRLPYKDEVNGRLVYGDVMLDKASRTARIGRRAYQGLPPAQFEFLARLVSSQGQAVSRRSLLRGLWRERVRDREVDVLVSRLKRRLGREAGARIASVRSFGYRLLPAA